MSTTREIDSRVAARLESIAKRISAAEARALVPGLAALAGRLVDYARALREESFRLVVAGSFSSGKSTLVNALIGAPDTVLTGATPTTTRITRIVRGQSLRLREIHGDGEQPEIDRDTYERLEAARLDCDDAEASSDQGIAEIEIAGTFPWLPEGLVITDTPGLHEDRMRTDLTIGHLPKANAIILLLNAGHLLTRAERELLPLLGHSPLRHVLVVINRSDGLSASDREALEHRARAKLAPYFRDPDAPTQASLLDERLFFTCARDGSGIDRLREAIETRLEEGAASGVPLHALVPSLAVVITEVHERVRALLDGNVQAGDDLDARVAASEQRLAALGDTAERIAERLGAAGEVLKHRIHRDLCSYVRQMRSTWHHDAMELDWPGLRLDATLTGVGSKARAQFIEALSRQLERYARRKLIQWGQRLPSLLAHDGARLFGDIHRDLARCGLELDLITAGLGTGSGHSTGFSINLYPASRNWFADLFGADRMVKLSGSLVRHLSDQLGSGALESIIGHVFGPEAADKLRRQLSGGDTDGGTRIAEREWQSAIRDLVIDGLERSLFEALEATLREQREALFAQVTASFARLGTTLGSDIGTRMDDLRQELDALRSERASGEALAAGQRRMLTTLVQSLDQDFDAICRDVQSAAMSRDEAQDLYRRYRAFQHLPEKVLPHSPQTQPPAQDIAPERALSTAVVPDLGKRFVAWMEQALGLPAGQDLGDLARVAPELSELIGLDEVKERIRDLVAVQEQTRKRREQGRDRGDAPLLHLVFTGNPGTGKTTVAKLMGLIYHRLGLLRTPKVIPKSMGDLTGAYVGHSERNTLAALDEAMDGILFVDEAHTLVTPRDSTDYSRKIVQVLVKEMEERRDRLALIVAGYPQPMERFLDQDEGLRSRFPNRIHFPDYEPAALMQILEQTVRTMGLQLAPETIASLQRVVTGLYAERDAHFGNGRVMRKLADCLRTAHDRRCYRNRLDTEPVRPQDIGPPYDAYLGRTSQAAIEAAMAPIRAMVGLEEVKLSLEALVQQATWRSGPEQAPDKGRLHMVLSGPPGTGKSTLARHMGPLLKALGLLRKDSVHRVSAATLLRDGLERHFEQALDGILFIDEAYGLLIEDAHHLGGQLITELIGLMDRYRDRIGVILAGYPAAMDVLLSANPGLSERFPRQLRLEPHSNEALLSIARTILARHKLQMSAAAEERLQTQLQQARLALREAFADVRTLENLVGDMRERAAVRLAREGRQGAADALQVIEASDVPQQGRSRISARRSGQAEADDLADVLRIQLIPAAADRCR